MKASSLRSSSSRRVEATAVESIALPLVVLGMTLAWLFVALLCATPVRAAESLDPDQIAHRLHVAMYPNVPSTRTLQISVESPDGVTSVWLARQARKSVGGKPSILTVMEAPQGVSGFAILAEALDENTDAQWVYVPPVQRVRRLVYEGRFENFLGTDLSVEDFGFIDLHPTHLDLLGAGEHQGQKAWVLREVPLDPSGYSKILTWVSPQTWLPMRRELYDRSGALWKSEYWENVAIIDDIPTPLAVEVVNHQLKSSTRLVVRDVAYGADLDDGLFEPASLPTAVTANW